MRCTECGTDNVVFSVDIPNFNFWLDENNCNSNCDECADTDCKSIQINLPRAVKWTKYTKTALKAVFDDDWEE